ncbi:MAG: hypothetical protein JWM34_4697 [Ilumatobacteraceae bacterium]|nr:hypothetical protein [Ilumatobacteraceae bacterium]
MALDQNERVWKDEVARRRREQAAAVTVDWVGQSSADSTEAWGRVATFNHSKNNVVGCRAFVLHQGVIVGNHGDDSKILLPETAPEIITFALPTSSATHVSDDERGLIFRDTEGLWWARLCSGALREISGPLDDELRGCPTWRSKDVHG